MNRRTKVLLLGLVALAILSAVSWFAPKWLSAKPQDALIIRSVLIALSGIIVGGVVWYLRSLTPAAPKAPTQIDEIAAVIGSAERHLPSSGIAGRNSLRELPLAIILGRPGSGKSTAVMRSALELDLLAGSAGQSSGPERVPAPTSTLNIWFSRGIGLVEVGWPVISDGRKWATLVDELQPRRLLAAVSGGRQTPRVVVVCVSAEELVAKDAPERTQALIREMRGPLSALSAAFGSPLPVYVIITKADRIVGFPEYVLPLTVEEGRDACGFTLPLENSATGSWSEREPLRISNAIRRLHAGFQQKRLAILEALTIPEKRLRAYEFPREWGKLAPRLSELLTELCRPSQLRVSPFVRGFYLVGIRPVLTQLPDAPTPLRPPAPAINASATMVFGSQGAAAPVHASEFPSDAAPRAQWAFLERLFSDVILQDSAAFRVTGQGVRLDGLRRSLLVAASLAASVWIAGMTVSYVRNRSLVATLNRHVASVRDLARPEPQAGPQRFALEQLDSLRAATEQLSEWVRDGAPLSYRWGLFRGSLVLRSAKAAYFDHLNRQLFADTRTSLLTRLRTLDGVPKDGATFDTTYSLLRALLVTSSQADSATGAFLGPVLAAQWSRSVRADTALARLAERQFRYLGDELPVENPYDYAEAPSEIANARQFLLRLPLKERVYQFIVGRASRTARSIRFDRDYPQHTRALSVGHEVPGAFTRQGRDSVDAALRRLPEFLRGEPWVLGDASAASVDKKALGDALRTRYLTESAAEWRAFLMSASVAAFGRDDAMRRLQDLAGNQSAIISLLAVVTRQTAGDTAYLAKRFQPVAVLATADSLKIAAEGAKEYLSALSRLGGDIEQVAKSKGADQALAARNASTTVTAAQVAVTAIAQQMQVDPAGAIDRQVLRLLREPLDFAASTLSGAGTGEINGAGASICSAVAPLLRKFPFALSASADATAREMNDVLKPGSGRIWQLYNERLSSVISKNADGTFAASGGGEIEIDPMFLTFLGRISRLAESLYANGNSEPRLEFSLRPDYNSRSLTQVTFSVNGQQQRFSASAIAEANDFLWSLENSRDARLVATIGAKTLDISESGPWAVVRLFARATGWSGRGSRTIAEFSSSPGGEALGDPVRLILSLPDDVQNILRRDFYAQGFACSGRVTR